MSKVERCPCCSGQLYVQCCEPYLTSAKQAPTAVALMRSRYTAYVLACVDYIIETTLPKNRRFYKKKDIELWAKESTWMKLEVQKYSETIVCFKAFYLDKQLQPQVHLEESLFKYEDDKWYFVEGN